MDMRVELEISTSGLNIQFTTSIHYEKALQLGLWKIHLIKAAIEIYNVSYANNFGYLSYHAVIS